MPFCIVTSFSSFSLADSGQVESQTSAHAGNDPGQQGQLGGTEQEETAWPERLRAGQPLQQRHHRGDWLCCDQSGQHALLQRRR